jgi:hypothetical protein
MDPEVIQLIRRMCRANPLWGAPRIHGELLKLGIEIAETTVAKYMIKRHGPPSQAWRTFLENYAQETIAIDFFTVGSVWITWSSWARAIFVGSFQATRPITTGPARTSP